MKRAYLILMLVLAVSAVAYHVATLMANPAPFVDEAWLAARSLGFVQTGQNAGALDTGVFDKVAGYWTCLPVLPSVFQGAVLLFAEPTLVVSRGVSLAFGFLLLAAVYLIGLRVGGRWLAFAATLIVAFSRAFIYCAHLARPDVMVAALGFSAIAVHLWNRRESPWVAFLAALLVSAAVECHPNGAIFGPTLGVLFLFEYRLGVLKKRHFWGFVAGGVTGIALYAALHILPYPASYVELNRIVFGASHTPPLVSFDLAIVTDAFQTFWHLLQDSHYGLIPFLVVAMVALAIRHRRSDLLLLVMAATAVLSFVLLVRNKFGYYGILYSPFLDLLLAAFACMCLEGVRQSNWPVRVLRVAAVAAFAWVFGSNLLLVQTVSYPAFVRAQEQIVAAVEPGESVMGTQTIWYGFHDRSYTSWEALVFYRRYYPGSSVREAFEAYRPDVFVIDGHMRNFITDVVQPSPYVEGVRLPKTELLTFLDERAEMVENFDGGPLGEVSIYRINW